MWGRASALHAATADSAALHAGPRLWRRRTASTRKTAASARPNQSPELTSTCVGDIAVIQATQDCKDGHIEAYDGTEWISDFIQKRGFWPGPSFRAETPDYVIYRWSA